MAFNTFLALLSSLEYKHQLMVIPVRGYLFLQFILLIFYIKIREKISANYTVEQTLLILRKLKCKVYDSQIIPAELTKNQKLIFEQTEILVPKFLGI